jgi:hypothetical protein
MCGSIEIGNHILTTICANTHGSSAHQSQSTVRPHLPAVSLSFTCTQCPIHPYSRRVAPQTHCAASPSDTVPSTPLRFALQRISTLTLPCYRKLLSGRCVVVLSFNRLIATRGHNHTTSPRCSRRPLSVAATCSEHPHRSRYRSQRRHDRHAEILTL